MQISAGVGPAEARRFVFLLAARLEVLAEARGLCVGDVVASGDGSAPRSITLYVDGGDALALADELGTHALIMRSDRRGRDARKRWFAAVTLHEVQDAPGTGTIARDELVITACRAGGPGGQHVNKVSTAVRVEHVPSGLTVRSAAARSQKANLDQAIARLAALLAARDDAHRADGERARRQAHYQLERGRAVRTYVLGDDGALEERSS
ncbi:MAG: peptide chain release factor-like protein [Deltaproteobacteria bacterium]|nr:peptide chain release factor-like protein [Deltaproteobacteria bacterium]